MKRVQALILVLSISFSAQAEGNALQGKVAVISLVGDVMTVDTYRRRIGTTIDSNRQEIIPVASPVFDETVISAAAKAIFPHLAPDSSVATLAVPAPGSNLDPARLLTDGAVSSSNALVAALRASDFTHLLAVTKHRGLARLQLADRSVGSGHLAGLGFYIDNDFRTTRSDTGESARGFIAPYAYIRLLLIDLRNLEIRGDQTVTASIARSAARNQTGFDPWGAMTAEEKVSMLQSLLKQHVAQAVPLLLAPK